MNAKSEFDEEKTNKALEGILNNIIGKNDPFTNIAKATKKIYDSFINAGFDDEQAMALTMNMMSLGRDKE